MFINGWTKEKVLEQIKKKNVGIVATDENDNCFYRQELDGKTNCCLVGAFIPDELYREGMETQSADSVIEEYSLEDYMPLSTDIMIHLQKYHDNDLQADMEDTDKSLYELVEEYLDSMKQREYN